MFEDLERAMREKAQQDSLRGEALANALQDWINDPRHNYSRAARKHGLTYSAFWNYVQKKRAEQAERTTDTEHGLKVVTLQTPKQE